MEIALSSDDMTAIAKAVDRAVGALSAFSDSTGFIHDDYVNVRVEIAIPGTETVAGEVRWYGDGYWAYFPRGES